MSAHKDFTLAPRASGSVSWVETLVISALALGLGWWFSPDDPLQVNATFPWVILAPLLLGMRYGFVRGLASAALLVAALFAFRVQGVEAYAQVPAAFIVGVLLCAMLVGEFRDIWERRLERLELANEYRQLRLDEFTRAHHILRISHDRLEQRVAGNDQSLRSSLLGLRQLLRELPGEEAPLDALAETVLALLAQYGSLRIAGLYRVRHDRTPEPQPLASLGEMPALDADDLLVLTCLERGELVSVRQELLERGEQRAHSALQVCVPLVDTDGRILALLAVVWLYYLMGSALRAPAAWLASAAFAVGALLELGQYLAAQLHWQFSSPVLRIVLGSTADGFDLLAYALGALLAWWLERRR